MKKAVKLSGLACAALAVCLDCRGMDTPMTTEQQGVVKQAIVLPSGVSEKFQTKYYQEYLGIGAENLATKWGFGCLSATDIKNIYETKFNLLREGRTTEAFDEYKPCLAGETIWQMTLPLNEADIAASILLAFTGNSETRAKHFEARRSYIEKGEFPTLYVLDAISKSNDL